MSEQPLLWKLYLWDETPQQVVTWTNRQTTTMTNGALDIPKLPVIIAVNILYDELSPRAVVAHERNYYTLVHGVEWYACTLSGLLNYLDTYRGNACVLRGTVVANATWREVFYYALQKDPEIHNTVVKIKTTQGDDV